MPFFHKLRTERKINVRISSTSILKIALTLDSEGFLPPLDSEACPRGARYRKAHKLGFIHVIILFHPFNFFGNSSGILEISKPARNSLVWVGNYAVFNKLRTERKINVRISSTSILNIALTWFLVKSNVVPSWDTDFHGDRANHEKFKWQNHTLTSLGPKNA